MLPAPLFHSPLMNLLSVYTCLQRGQWSQSHKTWNTWIFPARQRCIFPRTQSVAKGLASVGQLPTLHPPCSSSAKGVATGNTAFFFEIYLRQQHHPDRVQTNAVFLESLQFYSWLICLIISGLPHACLHNKLNQKTAPADMFKRCLKAYLSPWFRLCGQFSPLTSKNPTTTTSAESMKALAALVSVSVGRAPSKSERYITWRPKNST